MNSDSQVVGPGGVGVPVTEVVLGAVMKKGYQEALIIQRNSTHFKKNYRHGPSNMVEKEECLCLMQQRRFC